MFITQEKQNEIRDLIIKFAEGHISKAYGYDVEFQKQGDNVITRISLSDQKKQIANVQNIMTKQGYESMEARKAWNAWVLEHIRLLKSALEKKQPTPQSFFRKLLNKIKNG